MHDDEIICPITLETARVPVVTNNNYIYEFSAIATYILQNPIEPLDRRPIRSLRFHSSIEGQFLPTEETINIIRLFNQLYWRKIYLSGKVKLNLMGLLSSATGSDDTKIILILLINAIIRNDTRTIPILLADLRIDLNAFIDNMTPLISAIARGNRDIVELLLADERVDVNLVTDNKTPLIYAIDKGSKDIVPLLLDNKLVNVNQVTDNMTPLAYAIDRGSKDIVSLLLANELVDVNQVTDDMNPLMYAMVGRNIAIVSLLLDNKRVNVNQVTYHITPLMYAIAKEYRDIVELLLANERVDVNQVTDYMSPLIFAIVRRINDIVPLLLANKRVDVNQAFDNKTPLMYAIEEGDKDIVELLLANEQVDVNQAVDNKTPLRYAIRSKNVEMMRILLADPRIDVNQSVGYLTPLKYAIRKGNVEMVRILLADSRTDINPPLANEIYALANYNEEKIIAHIHNSFSPLQLAIEEDKQDIVSLLSHHEKLLALPNCDPRLTPFLIAIEQENISRIDEILGDFSLPNISNFFFARIRDRYQYLVFLYQEKLKLLLEKQSDPALRAALQKLCDEKNMCDIRHNIYLALALRKTCALLSDPTAQKCEDYKAFIAIMKSKQLGWCSILIEVLKIVSAVLIAALGGWTFPASFCVVPPAVGIAFHGLFRLQAAWTMKSVYHDMESMVTRVEHSVALDNEDLEGCSAVRLR